MKYKVGDILLLNIFGGIRKAEIAKIENNIIYANVYLKHGGYRKMFGYESDLDKLLSDKTIILRLESEEIL